MGLSLLRCLKPAQHARDGVARKHGAAAMFLVLHLHQFVLPLWRQRRGFRFESQSLETGHNTSTSRSSNAANDLRVPMPTDPSDNIDP